MCTEDANVSINDLHYKSVAMLTSELRNIGFQGLTQWDVMQKLYPHYLGHNLGLDVHDVPSYSKTAKLKKGAKGMGVRIEDDIAVGKNTNVNLTIEAAKE
ncbi:hypothetical protein HII12_001319, partial [Brettanomyces bruxellensis]